MGSLAVFKLDLIVSKLRLWNRWNDWKPVWMLKRIN